ncbi:hypothetical protein ACH40E_31550 [Streptomyces acidicola]|uniref:MmyB family transcriptional regulator n=1 Tax=Streptomyces acidicola TaxID=2596892 RepID=UPI0037B6C0B8
MTGLVDELRNASPDFARLWERHDVQATHGPSLLPGPIRGGSPSAAGRRGG